MSATPRLVEKEARALDPTSEEARRQKRGRRGALLLGAVAVAVLAGIGGYVLLTRGQEETDNAQVQSDMVPINARVGGPVLHVNVVDNARVKKGDVLVEIDPREYAVRLKQAEADLVAARAQAQASDAQVDVAEASARGGRSTARAVVSSSAAAVGNAEAQVEVARAAVVRAETDAQRKALELERVHQLRKWEIAAQQELDDALAASQVAQASLVGARAQLTAAEQARRGALSKVEEAQGQFDQSAPVTAKIAVARASAELAHAQVSVAEAGLEQARLQLEFTRVLAPGDGRVSKLTVREGQLLAAGQPVARLVPPQTYVVANFKETQVGRLRPGQRVEVRVDAFPGLSLTGQVESLSGGTGASFSLLPPDNASGNFVKVVQRVPVRISWKDIPKDLPLQAGLSAEVTVFTAGD